MLQTEAITIQVTSEAARAFREVSDDERKKLELLLSIQLLEVTKTRQSLKDVMSEISLNAQNRGLTPDILKELLAEE